MTDIVKDALKHRIKEHEGYRLDPYKDTLGYLTGGYGHKIEKGEDIPTTKEGWEEFFEVDFEEAWTGMERLCEENNLDICLKAQGVLCEMIFQMGYYGVSKFKNMIAALQEQKYDVAANEMLVSRWHRQTPQRSMNLSNEMRSCN